jgi:hypothetical protein
MGRLWRGGGVSVEEGRWLLMCLRKFYNFEGAWRWDGKEKRWGLLEKFSKRDQEFMIEELVDEAERDVLFTTRRNVFSNFNQHRKGQKGNDHDGGASISPFFGQGVSHAGRS